MTFGRQGRIRSREIIGFILGLVFFLCLSLCPSPPGLSTAAWRTAAVTVLMATWWVTEAIPIAATALVPVALFPLLGVMDSRSVVVQYANQNVYLFMGGFFIAMAMQKWNLHRRIALRIIRLVGCSPRRLVFGFMAATAFLSMWVSNTATTMMMLPIAIAVILEVSGGRTPDGGSSSPSDRNFGVALMLGVAYAASVGGICTLVGTPPNIVFAGQVAELFPGAPAVTFTEWMKIGVPVGLLFLPVIWFYLVFVASPLRGRCLVDSAPGALDEELRTLGRMNRGEKYTCAVFVMTALLWIFRADIVIGGFRIPGWSGLLPYPAYVHDSTVAIFMSLVLFILPVDLERREFALDWEWARKIPWGILILFGGGFALAEAFRVTGLAQWIGGSLGAQLNIGVFALILLTCLLMTFLTEVTSNTATTTMMMPVLASTAVSLGIHPFLLMIPATISASCAFMLPVATPPNAIVFSSGYISIPEMAKVGFWLNLIGVLLVSCVVYFVGSRVFGIQPGVLPVWAR